MKKYISLVLALVFSMASFAHDPNTSTTMLVEKENNVWVLQINASLTAFQQEINTHYSETPYKTPEEFRQMVLEHVKNNLHITYNGNKDIRLGKSIVKLGHETKVVFEVFGTPTTMNTVTIKNTIFEDIHKSQSALILLKEGFSKKHFILNNANDYTLALQVNGNEFTEVTVQKANLFPPLLLFAIIGFLGIGYLTLNIYKRRKMRLLEKR